MTKEEYASKLHLLQQEYEAMKHDRDVYLTVSQRSGQDLYELHQKHAHLQQEYDKLKGEKSFQVDINLGLHKEIIELKKEHAALKEKAEKMVEALNTILNTNYDNHERVILKVKAIADEALSSYNTNNQNENDG